MNCLGSALQTCIEFEEQNLRIGLPFDQSGSKTDMTTMLQMMQEMHNRMISFEHRLVTDPKMTQAPPLCLMSRPEISQSGESSMRHWCNFCDEAHDPTTCETFLVAKEHTKWKKNIPTVTTIKIEEIDDDIYTTVTQSQTPF